MVCLLLFNVLETQNAMKLDNIYSLSEPDCPSAKMIKTIRDLPSRYKDRFNSLKNDKQCDFRDLLWCLQNAFSEVDTKGTKFGSKRAFIFTNNDKPLCKDEQATVAKAKDMFDANIDIMVFPLSPNFQMATFYGGVCSLDMDELASSG